MDMVPLLCVLLTLSFTTASDIVKVDVSSKSDDPYGHLHAYHIVQPIRLEGNRRKRDLSTRTHDKVFHLSQPSFSIRTPERDFVIDLELNTGLLSDRFIEVTFDSEGQRRTKKLHPERCYYHGKIRGIDESNVVVHTCRGINGMIHDGDEIHYIEPHIHDDRDTPQNHVVYRKSDIKNQPKEMKCGHNSTIKMDHTILKEPTEAKSRKKRAIPTYNSALTTRYVELYSVTDYRTYQRYSSNITAIRTRAVQLANTMDSIYKTMNVRVVLVAVEVWSSSDKATVSTDEDATVDAFCHYKENNLPMKILDYDNAQLLIGTDLTGSTVGYAPLKSMCSKKRSCGITMDFNNVEQSAYIMAHEMGHNLGMTHDDGRTCSSCAHSGGCVMSSVLQSSPLAWTQCSVDDINANNWNCLNDAPTASYEKSCGNGIKEEGEECDCGTAAECPTADPCCETTGCKLKSTSQCGDGPCCSNCQFRTKGTSCRAVATECDIAESCNGVSNLCPEDNYLSDGTDCNSTTGYCYAGQCRTHDSQCQYLFGSTAVKAQDACWDLVNKGGDQYGNCGKLSNGTYTVCATADILCGKLQCTIPGSSGAVLPVIGNSKTGTSVTTTFSNGTTIACNGGDADFGDDAPSPGLTADGTKCGTQKMCLSNRCRSFSEISVGVSCGQVNGQTCAGRGYCNQDNQCVCRDNYDPGSNCENTINENALLTCYKCSDADACGGTPNSANSTTELCTSNEQICQVVRLARTGQTTHYTRGCVYKTSCTEECQTTSGDTKCVDCCQTSRCNTGNGEPTAESSGIKTTISTAATFTLSLLVLLL